VCEAKVWRLKARDISTKRLGEELSAEKTKGWFTKAIRGRQLDRNSDSMRASRDSIGGRCRTLPKRREIGCREYKPGGGHTSPLWNARERTAIAY